MKTLSGSSSKLFSNRDRGFASPRDDVVLCLSRPKICFFGYPKQHDSFLIFVSPQNRSIHPILASSSLSSSSDTQTHLQDEETQIKDTSHCQTVHVKFQLQRECSFGQQFLIVGDDPIFGLWDPLNAVPLNWSDEHVWAIELDIPMGKSIKYKFILKESTDYILWQPGPDRILQTWETDKTITVYEDWENAELQTIMEEEPTSDQHDESAVNPEVLLIAENLTDPWASLTTELKNRTAITDSVSIAMKKPLTEKLMAIITENITEPEETPRIISAKEEHVVICHLDMATGGNNIGNNSTNVNLENLASRNDEIKLVSHEVPVLVPGSTPLPIAYPEEASLNAVEKNVEEEPDNALPHPKQAIEIMFNEERENKHIEQPLLAEQDRPNTKLFNSLLENYIQTSRRKLQKFLRSINLGFPIS